ncbi:MAG: TolC family protein, partial [Cytophagales bacterium]|nr:TolC family protein [Armatimonadota bacterium]
MSVQEAPPSPAPPAAAPSPNSVQVVPAVPSAPAVPTVPLPASPTPLTLGGAIALALESQPSLLQANAQQQASEQRLNQARSTYFPTLAPNYSYTNNYSFTPTNQFVPTFDPVTGQQTGGSFITVSRGRVFDARQGDISLSYRVYDNTRELASRQSRQNFRAATFGTADTRQSVIATVASAYFQALQNDALVRVSNAQVARARNTLAVLEAQVEVGVAARKDTLQAQADLLNAQVNLLQAQNNAQIAQIQLRNAIGILGTGAGAPSRSSGTGPSGAPASTRLPLADVPAPSPDTPLTADITASAPAAASAVASP